MRATVLALACCLAFFSVQTMARPSLLEDINAARASGCGGKRGTSTPLRSNRKLDAAARRIARGEGLRDALQGAGYRATHSSVMSMSGAKDNADIARMLRQRACTDLRSEDVREIGMERRGDRVWVVFAAPFDTGALKNESLVRERALALANEARSRPRRCGSKSFPAAPPLTLENHLTSAAREHARDMATHNMLEHTGSDGSRPDQRVTRAGYKWRATGENIAAGPTSADEVMAGWLASPGHCENIMSPRFREMGIAWVADPKSASGVYWAQVFGTPRD